MAFSAKLAELFVEFITKGTADLTKAVDGIKGKIENLNASIGLLNKLTFADIAARLTALATAGIQTSVMGDLLSFRMQQLALAMAGLFRPELEKILNLLERAVQWFQKLSDQQRENIVHWIEAAVVALGVAAVLPKIVAGVKAVIAAIQLLTAAFLGLDVASGGILPLIGAIVTGITALAVGTEFGRNALSAFWKAMQPLIDGFKMVMHALEPLWKALSQFATSMMSAFKPIFQAIGQIFKELVPIVVQLATIFASILAPIIRLITMIGAPLLKLFATFAGLLMKLVIPVLKLLAWILEKVAAAIEMTMKALSTIPIIGGLFKAEEEETGKKKKPDRSPLAPRLGGFESSEAAYKRIAAATIQLQGGKSTAEQQLDVAQQQLEVQKRTDDKIGNLKGAYA